MDAESRWLRVIDQLGDGIFLLDPATLRVVEANRAFGEMIGAPASDLPGLPIVDFIDHDAESVARNVEACLRDESRVVGERRYRRRDGIVIDVEVTTTVVPTSAGPLLAAIVRDVTGRKRVERALAASEERFRLVCLATNDAVWDWDLDTDRIWYSDGLRTHFGLESVDVRTDSAWWWERIWPEDIDRVVGGIHSTIDGGGSAWSEEYRFRRGDGSYASVSDRGFVIRDSQGRPLRMAGARIDITNRVRTEQELRRLSRDHQLIVQAAAEGIVGTDRFGRITFANAAALRMTGWTSEELIGRPLHAVIHHSRLDGTPFLEEECPSTEALRSGLARKSPLEWFWRRDGAPFPVEYAVAPAREGRDIVGCVMTFRDISEQRALEEARADGEARIRAILEAVPDLMFRVTRNGRFVDFNAPRTAALYAPPSSFIGRPVDEVLPAAVARGALGAVAEALDEGGVRRFEYELDMPSGPTRYEGRAVRCTENDALVICRQVSPAPA